jgi:pilus assembly protein Flp/PilA
MRSFLKLFVRDDRGVSAMEYAVLAGIIVVALGGFGAAFKSDVNSMFTTMFAAIKTQQAQ